MSDQRPHDVQSALILEREALEEFRKADRLGQSSLSDGDLAGFSQAVEQEKSAIQKLQRINSEDS